MVKYSKMSSNISDIFELHISSLNKNNDSRKKEIKTLKKDIYSILKLLSKTNKEFRKLKSDISHLKNNIHNKDPLYVQTALTQFEKQAEISSSDLEDCSDLEDSINEYIRLQIKYQLDIELENINTKFDNMEKLINRFTKKLVDTSEWHVKHNH